MSDVYTPSRPLRSPTDAEMQIGEPVLGRTAATLLSGLQGLHGSRFKRIVPFQCVMAGPPFDDNGTASTLRYDFRFRWRTSPYATHAYVGLWVVAEIGQSTAPKIDLDIYDDAPALVDSITWESSDGSLPLAPKIVNAFAGPGNWGVTATQDDYIDTGWQTAEEVAGGPRLLTLGAPGTWHSAQFSPLGARVYSGVIVEVDKGIAVGP